MNGSRQRTFDPRTHPIVWLLGVAVAAFVLGVTTINGINHTLNRVNVPTEEHDLFLQQSKTINALQTTDALRDRLERNYGLFSPKTRGWANVFHVAMNEPTWRDQVNNYLSHNGPPLDGVRGALSGNNDIYLWAEVSNAKVQWSIKCQHVVSGDATWSTKEFPQKLQAGAVPIGLADRTDPSWHDTDNPAPHSLCLWYLEPKSLLNEVPQAPLGQN